ncbi:MAG: nucleoside 2-deoxyribosyltransferase [Pseudomonadales bacterium]
MKIYLAGPLFTPIEREFIERIADELATACTVYVPHRDGLLVEELLAKGCSRSEVYRAVYQRDIDEIHKCDVLLAILDGRAPDEGVCVEIGYAKALGKRIVGLKTDIRIALPWGNNPMIDGCIDQWAKTPYEAWELIRTGSANLFGEQL